MSGQIEPIIVIAIPCVANSPARLALPCSIMARAIWSGQLSFGLVTDWGYWAVIVPLRWAGIAHKVKLPKPCVHAAS